MQRDNFGSLCKGFFPPSKMNDGQSCIFCGVSYGDWHAEILQTKKALAPKTTSLIGYATIIIGRFSSPVVFAGAFLGGAAVRSGTEELESESLAEELKSLAPPFIILKQKKTIQHRTRTPPTAAPIMMPMLALAAGGAVVVSVWVSAIIAF